MSLNSTVDTDLTRSATRVETAPGSPAAIDRILPLRVLDRDALRDVARAFVGSRLLVWVVALIVAHVPSYSSSPADIGLVFRQWPPSGVLGWLFDPFVRGDAVYLLGVTLHGYKYLALSTMFPGFPMAVRLLGGSTSPLAAVVVGCLFSSACFAAALYVLHRLVTVEAGARTARATVYLLAFSPLALFFSVPYTESLFLLLSVSALYAARRERWLLACVLAAGAAVTRNVGIMLILPIALLFLYPSLLARDLVRGPGSWLTRIKPERPPGLALLYVLLIPVGLGLFSLYLRQRFGDALAWEHAETFYGRQSGTPWATVINGLRAAWHFETTAGIFHGVQLQDAAYLILAGVGTVAVLRLLPFAYGVYTVALLLPALAAPAIVQEPLRSFPRYTLVAFPLFIALAKLSERYRVTAWVVGLSGLGLIGLTAAYVGYWPYV